MFGFHRGYKNIICKQNGKRKMTSTWCWQAHDLGLIKKMNRPINKIFRKNYYKLQVITCGIIFLLFVVASYANIIQSLDNKKETAGKLIELNWSHLLTVRLMGDDESLQLVIDELNKNEEQIKFYYSLTNPEPKTLSYTYQVSYGNNDYGYIVYNISLGFFLVSRLYWLMGLLVLGGLFVYLFHRHHTNILRKSIIVPLEKLFNKISDKV